ncbi:MAG: hypothetical protein WAU91_23060 [Desulfatitalea sp.]
MKKFLVVYYSQSGQLTRILNSLLKPIIDSGQIELVFEELQPAAPYPFPWSLMTFIDAMPESVREIPCRLEPFHFDPEAHYDGIILAYQVWYLSPSIPINAFLQSPEAARVMRNRPVITIIGCRNMWLHAHERVKKHIARQGGRPAANIVLMDRAPNLLSIVSITAWMMTGRQDRFLKIFPKPGVDEQEIMAADRFGHMLLPALAEGRWAGLQIALNRIGAVTIIPAFIFFEQRVAKIFNLWAKFIRHKGGPGAPARRGRLTLFIIYLLTAIVVLSPIAALLSFLLRMLKINKIKQLTDYYAGNTFDPEGSR